MAVIFLAGCSANQKNEKRDSTHSDTVQVAKTVKAKPAREYTDTLQFIHFDGNSDYWNAFFINAKKDTIRLVTDEELTDKLSGKLLQVKWREDTLTEAGDGERPYQDKRLIAYKTISGKPYAQPVTEEMALAAVKNLPEVQSNADRVGISEKPTTDKPYYQVETSTKADGNLSRFHTFRVYVYPQFEIKVYNYENDKDIPLSEWRKSH